MSVFCTIDDVKRLAPINSQWTGFNTTITALIPVVTEQIRTFCRRKFSLAEYTEYFASPDSLSKPVPVRLYVNEPPIQNGSVFLDYDATGRFVNSQHIAELTEGTDFSVDYETGMITLLADFAFNARGLKIVYNGGYAVTNDDPPRVQVPAQIVTACAMQVAFLLERNMAAQTGQTSDDTKSGSVQFTVSAMTGLISEAQSMVSSFRRALVGRS